MLASFNLFAKGTDSPMQTEPSSDIELPKLREAIVTAIDKIALLTATIEAEESVIQTKKQRIKPLEKQWHEMIRECKAKELLLNKINEFKKELLDGMHEHRREHEMQLNALDLEKYDIEQALERVDGLEEDARQIFEQRLLEIEQQTHDMQQKYVDPRMQQALKELEALQLQRNTLLIPMFVSEILQLYLQRVDDKCAEIQQDANAEDLAGFFNNFFSNEYRELRQDIKDAFFKEFARYHDKYRAMFVQEFIAKNVVVLKAGKSDLVSSVGSAKQEILKTTIADCTESDLQHWSEAVVKNLLDRCIERLQVKQEQTSREVLWGIIAREAAEYLTDAVCDCNEALKANTAYLTRLKSMITPEIRDEINLTDQYYKKMKELYEYAKQQDLTSFLGLYPYLFLCQHELNILYRNAETGYLAKLRNEQKLLFTTEQEEQKILTIKVELCRIKAEKHQALFDSWWQQLHCAKPVVAYTITIPNIFRLLPFAEHVESIANSLIKDFHEYQDSVSTLRHEMLKRQQSAHSLSVIITYHDYERALIDYLEFDKLVRSNPTEFTNRWAERSKQTLLALKIFAAYHEAGHSDKETPQKIAFAQHIEAFEQFHAETYESGDVCRDFKPDISLLVNISNCLQSIKHPPVLKDLPNFIEALIQILHQEKLEEESQFTASSLHDAADQAPDDFEDSGLDYPPPPPPPPDSPEDDDNVFPFEDVDLDDGSTPAPRP